MNNPTEEAIERRKQRDMVNEWNKRYRPGISVLVDMGEGEEVTMTTVGRAEWVAGQTAAIRIGGIGLYRLDRVKAVEQ